MKSNLLKELLLSIAIILAALSSLKAQTDEAEAKDPEYFVELDPITVHGKSVKDSGFSFVVKFRYKIPFSGIKTLVVTKVGEDSPAAKAGIQKGAKIIRIRNTNVDGLSIKRLQKVLQEKSDEGISLTIIPKGAEEAEQVTLEFEFEKTKRQKKADKKKQRKDQSDA